MSTNHRRFKGTIVSLVVLGSTIPLGTERLTAVAQEAAQEGEHAYARWTVSTSQGPMQYEIDAYRATDAGEAPVTTGYISTRICSNEPGERHSCISAAGLKRISDDGFEIDTSVSEARLKMRFAGTRHTAMWDASGAPPEIALDRIAERDASVEREAEAAGEVFGNDLPERGVVEAAIERSAQAGGSDLPPSPQGPLLPGFGGSSGSSSCWKVRAAERGFVRAHNEERAARGLRRLRLDPELSKAARVHTREMTRADLLHHTDPSALRRRVTNWVLLGENVGVGATVASLHDAFMASPAHKENIMLPRFKFIGVGTASSDNRLWVTVIFESRRNPGTPLRIRCR